MKGYVKNLGKVCMTADGPWDNSKEWDRLCAVYYIDNNNNVHSFVSRKRVPIGIPIQNREYWQPLAITIRIDNGGTGGNGNEGEGQIGAEKCTINLTTSPENVTVLAVDSNNRIYNTKSFQVNKGASVVITCTPVNNDNYKVTTKVIDSSQTNQDVLNYNFLLDSSQVVSSKCLITLNTTPSNVNIVATDNKGNIYNTKSFQVDKGSVVSVTCSPINNNNYKVTTKIISAIETNQDILNYNFVLDVNVNTNCSITIVTVPASATIRAVANGQVFTSKSFVVPKGTQVVVTGTDSSGNYNDNTIIISSLETNVDTLNYELILQRKEVQNLNCNITLVLNPNINATIRAIANGQVYTSNNFTVPKGTQVTVTVTPQVGSGYKETTRTISASQTTEDNLTYTFNISEDTGGDIQPQYCFIQIITTPDNATVRVTDNLGTVYNTKLFQVPRGTSLNVVATPSSGDNEHKVTASYISSSLTNTDSYIHRITLDEKEQEYCHISVITNPEDTTVSAIDDLNNQYTGKTFDVPKGRSLTVTAVPNVSLTGYMQTIKQIYSYQTNADSYSCYIDMQPEQRVNISVRGYYNGARFRDFTIRVEDENGHALEYEDFTIKNALVGSRISIIDTTEGYKLTYSPDGEVSSDGQRLNDLTVKSVMSIDLYYIRDTGGQTETEISWDNTNFYKELSRVYGGRGNNVWRRIYVKCPSGEFNIQISDYSVGGVLQTIKRVVSNETVLEFKLNSTNVTSLDTNALYDGVNSLLGIITVSDNRDVENTAKLILLYNSNANQIYLSVGNNNATDNLEIKYEAVNGKIYASSTIVEVASPVEWKLMTSGYVNNDEHISFTKINDTQFRVNISEFESETDVSAICGVYPKQTNPDINGALCTVIGKFVEEEIVPSISGVNQTITTNYEAKTLIVNFKALFNTLSAEVIEGSDISLLLTSLEVNSVADNNVQVLTNSLERPKDEQDVTLRITLPENETQDSINRTISLIARNNNSYSGDGGSVIIHLEQFANSEDYVVTFGVFIEDDGETYDITNQCQLDIFDENGSRNNGDSYSPGSRVGYRVYYNQRYKALNVNYNDEDAVVCQGQNHNIFKSITLPIDSYLNVDEQITIQNEVNATARINVESSKQWDIFGSIPDWLQIVDTDIHGFNIKTLTSNNFRDGRTGYIEIVTRGENVLRSQVSVYQVGLGNQCTLGWLFGTVESNDEVEHTYLIGSNTNSVKFEILGGIAELVSLEKYDNGVRTVVPLNDTFDGVHDVLMKVGNYYVFRPAKIYSYAYSLFPTFRISENTTGDVREVTFVVKGSSQQDPNVTWADDVNLRDVGYQGSTVWVPYLNADPLTLNFDENSSSKNVNISTNIEHYDISINGANWISVQKNERGLIVSVTENSGSERSGSITLITSELQDIIISVNQVGNQTPPIPPITPTEQVWLTLRAIDDRDNILIPDTVYMKEGDNSYSSSDIITGTNSEYKLYAHIGSVVHYRVIKDNYVTIDAYVTVDREKTINVVLTEDTNNEQAVIIQPYPADARVVLKKGTVNYENGSIFTIGEYVGYSVIKEGYVDVNVLDSDTSRAILVGTTQMPYRVVLQPEEQYTDVVVNVLVDGVETPNVANALIYLDGVYQGTGNGYILRNLLVGSSHNITVKLTGYPDYVGAFTVQVNTPIYANFGTPTKYTLSVNMLAPSDAEIFVNNYTKAQALRFVGQCFTQIDAGDEITIQIQKSGYYTKYYPNGANDGERIVMNSNRSYQDVELDRIIVDETVVYTLNTIPADATVEFTLSETGEYIVSNSHSIVVPKFSIVYYRISKEGYKTVLGNSPRLTANYSESVTLEEATLKEKVYMYGVLDRDTDLEFDDQDVNVAVYINGVESQPTTLTSEIVDEVLESSGQNYLLPPHATYEAVLVNAIGNPHAFIVHEGDTIRVTVSKQGYDSVEINKVVPYYEEGGESERPYIWDNIYIHVEERRITLYPIKDFINQLEIVPNNVYIKAYSVSNPDVLFTNDDLVQRTNSGYTKMVPKGSHVAYGVYKNAYYSVEGIVYVDDNVTIPINMGTGTDALDFNIAPREQNIGYNASIVEFNIACPEGYHAILLAPNANDINITGRTYDELGYSLNEYMIDSIVLTDAKLTVRVKANQSSITPGGATSPRSQTIKIWLYHSNSQTFTGYDDVKTFLVVINQAGKPQTEVDFVVTPKVNNVASAAGSVVLTVTDLDTNTVLQGSEPDPDNPQSNESFAKKYTAIIGHQIRIQALLRGYAADPIVFYASAETTAYDINLVSEPSTISASPTQLTFEANDTAKSVVVSDSEGWSAVANEIWIDAQVTATGVEITCGINPSTTSRTGIVTITDTATSQTVVINITQEGDTN